MVQFDDIPLRKQMQCVLVNSPSLHEEDAKTKMSQIKELYEDVEDGYKRLHVMAKKPKGMDSKQKNRNGLKHLFYFCQSLLSR